MRRFRITQRRRRFAAGTLVSLAFVGTATITSAAGADGVGAQMSVRAQSASYNDAVAMSGTVARTPQGQPVRVAFRSAGNERWREIRTVGAAPSGAFSTKVRVRRSGEWRAVPRVGEPSTPKRIVVRADLSLRRPSSTVMSGRSAVVRGVLRPARAGEIVRIQIRRGSRWLTVDRARTRRGGSFTAAWRARVVGRYAVRALFGGDAVAAADRTGSRRFNVYRRSFASYYGPGFFGARTACGQTLTPSTLGVAHKTLPCGTRVTFRKGARTVTVRVIDRGPFHAGRDWDLTSATKQRLGFGSTGTVLSTK